MSQLHLKDVFIKPGDDKTKLAVAADTGKNGFNLRVTHYPKGERAITMMQATVETEEEARKIHAERVATAKERGWVLRQPGPGIGKRTPHGEIPDVRVAAEQAEPVAEQPTEQTTEQPAESAVAEEAPKSRGKIRVAR